MEALEDIWAAIAEQTEKNKRSVDTVFKLDDFNHMAITGHSTRIEGSTLTLDETILLLQEGLTGKGKPIDHYNMALDHHEALQFVLGLGASKKLLDIDSIKTIGAMVMRRTGKTVVSVLGETQESRGDFRKVNVSAGTSFFGGFDKIPKKVQSLIDNVNSRIQSLTTPESVYTLAFIAHFDLVTIHPFTDGNGRTSRLLMNYVEAFHGLPLTVVRSENKVEYINSLKASREQESVMPIVTFLAKEHLGWLQELEYRFKKETQRNDLNEDKSQRQTKGAAESRGPSFPDWSILI